MATVWVYWDGVPKVFSSPEAATKWRNETAWQARLEKPEIFEAVVDADRLTLFQEWELESDKTYRAIGRFMYEFSQVEYSLRHVVGDELGIKEAQFEAVTTSFDVGVLCNLATSVFRERQNAEKIKALINRFRALNNHRQRVAHGLWMPFLDGGSVHYTARTSLKGSSHKQQADALEVLADEALSLRNEFSEEITGIGIYFQSEEDYDPKV